MENNNQHYYTENPTSEIIEKTFTHDNLTFKSVSGVFGFSDHIDKASLLLINNFYPSDISADVLDIGCGFGAIGLSLKSNHPEINIHMVDINNRAVEYAKANANANNLTASIVAGDLFEPFSSTENKVKFSDIVSNPPIAVGKAFNTRLIEESAKHLLPNGSLWLVAFHNKGGSTLKKIMQQTFGNVEDVVKSGGIRVYRSFLE